MGSRQLPVGRFIRNCGVVLNVGTRIIVRPEALGRRGCRASRICGLGGLGFSCLGCKKPRNEDSQKVAPLGTGNRSDF